MLRLFSPPRLFLIAGEAWAREHGCIKPTGTVLGLLLLCFGTIAISTGAPLPADVSMNDNAGRGGDLIVTLRLENGEELPLILDTGTTSTFFDQSLESKLGKPLRTERFQSWGVIHTNNVYALPKLYWGDTPLPTNSCLSTFDFHGQLAESGHPVVGILGMDILKNYCLQLDFAAGKIHFLDDEHADKTTWGRAYPIVPLNAHDARPAVAENLLGVPGPHSLIDSGCNFDGWLMPPWYQQWTNQALLPTPGLAHSPDGRFDGQKYLFVDLPQKDVESDGLGLRFLARHLVTLDFPKQTLYLQRQSLDPLPERWIKTTRMAALEPLIQAVLLTDTAAAHAELAKIEQSHATAREKTVARKLAATIADRPKPVPAEVPGKVILLLLGDARPDHAEVGWLTPAANRIPLNDQIESPLLDSGKIYATGLFAHAPSRYVYNLGGHWKRLRGEAGLHTVLQPYAYGVIFVIKTDGREMFRSATIRGTNHAVYDLNVTGVKTLELLVEKAQDQNGGNWGLWLDPMLSR
jgi:hypothetical protein